AGVARVSDAYAHFATLMRELKLPAELSADEQKQVRAALAAKADEAQKRATSLRQTCAKKAESAMVFSEAGKSCLLEQPLPEKMAIFPRAAAQRAGERPQATTLRQELQKNPRDAVRLGKLAELYLGQGDLGMTLLLVDRAEDIDPKRSELENLRGVALYKAGD